MTELNRFVGPGPELRPVPATEPGRFDYRALPPKLFCTFRERFLAGAKARRRRQVPRTE
jgi:hypothetical protein